MFNLWEKKKELSEKKFCKQKKQTHTHSHTNREDAHRETLCLLTARQAGTERPPKHLAHIMRRGRSTGASGGTDGLVMGGATGICQSSRSPQRMSRTLLPPSLCKGWRDSACSSAATCLAGRMNYHLAETDNNAQVCSTDEKQTLIKPVCSYSVWLDTDIDCALHVSSQVTCYELCIAATLLQKCSGSTLPASLKPITEQHS